MLNTDTIQANFCPVCGSENLYWHKDKNKCPLCGEEFLVVDPEKLRDLEAEAGEEKLCVVDEMRLVWLEENRVEVASFLDEFTAVDDALRVGGEAFAMRDSIRADLDQLLTSLEALP